MSEMKHTRGPWTAIEDYDGEWCVALDHADGGLIATIEPGRQEAGDAHLIAAAPELFEIVKMIRDSIVGGGRVVTFQDIDLAEMDAAIAKATGAEPTPTTDDAQGALFDLPKPTPPSAIREGR